MEKLQKVMGIIGKWYPVLLTLLLSAALCWIGHVSDQRDSYQSLAEAQQDTVRIWRNKYGKARAEKKSVLASKQALRSYYRSRFDSLEKQMDIKMKHMRSLIGVGSVTERRILATVATVPIYMRDTVTVKDAVYFNAEAFHFQDKWLTIDGLLINKRLDLVYTHRDSINLVTSWKRKNIFHRRALTIDAVSYNPFSTITGLDHMEVSIRPRRFGIGPYVGISPSGWSVGVSIHYSIIQF